MQTRVELEMTVGWALENPILLLETVRKFRGEYGKFDVVNDADLQTITLIWDKEKHGENG